MFSWNTNLTLMSNDPLKGWDLVRTGDKKSLGQTVPSKWITGSRWNGYQINIQLLFYGEFESN